VGDILLRRTIDQSDRSVAYEAAPLDDDEIEGIEPWNCEPRATGWEDITEARAREIAESL
jgi:hypothetical protein